MVLASPLSSWACAPLTGLKWGRALYSGGLPVLHSGGVKACCVFLLRSKVIFLCFLTKLNLTSLPPCWPRGGSPAGRGALAATPWCSLGDVPSARVLPASRVLSGEVAPAVPGAAHLFCSLRSPVVPLEKKKTKPQGLLESCAFFSFL